MPASPRVRRAEGSARPHSTAKQKKMKRRDHSSLPDPGMQRRAHAYRWKLAANKSGKRKAKKEKKKANDFAGVARSNTRQRKDVSDTHTVSSVRVHSSRARAKGGEVGGFRAHSVACQASPGKRQRLSAMLNDSSIANSHASCL